MVKAFISYSHKDESLRNELESHLSMLKRGGVIETWHDRRIVAGSELDSAISEQLETAHIIMLLISSDFLASNYCYDIEMRRALQMHKEGTAVVVPVILRPCDWHASPFGGLMATPTDGLPVTKFPNQDEAFTTIVREVRRVAAGFKMPTIAPTEAAAASVPTQAHPLAVTTSLGIAASAAPRSSNLRVLRKFNDHERDAYLENAYEYMGRFFEKSLGELQERNTQISTRFKRIDAESFTASIYANGERVSACSIVSGPVVGFGGSSIRYSSSVDAPRNSWNEQLSVGDDGYTLHLHGGYMRGSEKRFTEEGAAELLWGMLMQPLQR